VTGDKERLAHLEAGYEAELKAARPAEDRMVPLFIDMVRHVTGCDHCHVIRGFCPVMTDLAHMFATVTDDAA
jgi:hypothetical protein